MEITQGEIKADETTYDFTKVWGIIQCETNTQGCFGSGD